MLTKGITNEELQYLLVIMIPIFGMIIRSICEGDIEVDADDEDEIHLFDEEDIE